MKPIALIKTGCTIDQIRLRHGDFEDWFARGMGEPDLVQVDVFRDALPPDPAAISGVVLTGSAAMVSEREDWSERTAAWLAKAVEARVPVLGVCYGHQLLARALGGVVGPNPKGRQIGTVCVERTEASRSDPLLGHLPWSFQAQATHSEVILELPPGAVRLARCDMDDNFAVRFADNAWGVQFHPEFSREVMLLYLYYRSDVLRREGLDPDRLREDTAEAEAASSVLRTFVGLLDGAAKRGA